MDGDFKQGDIIMYEFPEEETRRQFTIRGWHPALILHDYTHPNQTFILSPLSSLYEKNNKKKELQSYHLELLKKDYRGLTKDSYVKLDQLMTFSRHLARNSRYIDTLTDKDRAALHLKLIETLQMQDTLSEIVTKQIEKAVNNLLEEHLPKIIENYKGN